MSIPSYSPLSVGDVLYGTKFIRSDLSEKTYGFFLIEDITKSIATLKAIKYKKKGDLMRVLQPFQKLPKNEEKLNTQLYCKDYNTALVNLEGDSYIVYKRVEQNQNKQYVVDLKSSFRTTEW